MQTIGRCLYVPTLLWFALKLTVMPNSVQATSKLQKSQRLNRHHWPWTTASTYVIAWSKIVSTIVHKYYKLICACVCRLTHAHTQGIFHSFNPLLAPSRSRHLWQRGARPVNGEMKASEWLLGIITMLIKHWTFWSESPQGSWEASL